MTEHRGSCRVFYTEQICTCGAACPVCYSVPIMNLTIDKPILDLLTDFAVFLSPTWEAGNEDDEEAASKAVDAFVESLPKANGED